jgi:CheY-like chemotaxis protein
MTTPQTFCTILLVEDDALLRWVAAEMAEDAGYRVLQASDADAALKIIADHREIGILVTDVHMPGSMDGVDLARVVHDRWPRVELIVMSGRLRPLNNELPDDGIFIPKPYTEAQFIAALQSRANRVDMH